MNIGSGAHAWVGRGCVARFRLANKLFCFNWQSMNIGLDLTNEGPPITRDGPSPLNTVANVTTPPGGVYSGPLLPAPGL